MVTFGVFEPVRTPFSRSEQWNGMKKKKRFCSEPNDWKIMLVLNPAFSHRYGDKKLKMVPSTSLLRIQNVSMLGG